MGEIKVRQFQSRDKAELMRLARLLFTGITQEEYEAEWGGHVSLGSGSGVPGSMFVVDRGDGRLGGYAEVTLRNVVDGCTTSPAGYLEALYVDEDLRRHGFARALISAAEDWARSEGCMEMGSDCLISNDVSFMTHQAMGYEEVDRCINFRKSLTRPALNLERVMHFAMPALARKRPRC